MSQEHYPSPGSQSSEPYKAVHPDDPMVGTVLAGRYRILDKLGAGAMGTVYVGEHLKMGRRDAIKLLTSPNARNPESMARFIRGARNLAQIRHPNVCTVYDFGETQDGTQFLAIELVSGGALSDLVERAGALPVARALRIAIQIANGLQAAHDQGIVHRDLKPDNVMITQDRTGRDLAKVVDFDIAKAEQEEVGPGVTRMGHVVGTPQYMSPEQLTGDHLDGRSDLYSLGALIFWMLTKTLPFEGETSQELMIYRLTRDPLTLSHAAPGRFPAGLERLLIRVLSREVEGRPDSAATLARMLEGFLPEGRSLDNEEAPTQVVQAVQEDATQIVQNRRVVHPTTLAPVRRSSSQPADQAAVEESARIEPQRARPLGRWSIGLLGTAAVTLVAVMAIPESVSDSNRADGSGDTPVALNQAGGGEGVPPETPPADHLQSSPSDLTGADLSTPSGPRPEDDQTTSRNSLDDPARSPSGPPADTRTSPTDGANSADDRSDRERSPSGLETEGLDRSQVLSRVKSFASELAPQTSTPERATALQDSATVFWAMETMGTEIRHWSAYVAGLAELNLDNPTGAIRWMDRALALDPDNKSYRAVRDALSGTR